ncbi:3-hydroxyacyl-CoA dehydrogenase NAD-binding domain-containing protein [Niveispirillum fermenti]|uniref:3-hydroxyacyl-CoA dehydrogenase NAD-binding domain-containing protein n=1 Tax=Niveispirillum fermenti TaxID=1233113 RepID=UPI003A85D085
MTQPVRYDRQGAIGIVTIDSPPVNALSQAVRQGVIDCVGQGYADPAVTALVIVGAGRTFIAGADITEFIKGGMADPDLNDVNALIENGPKPVIAALHGTALGGGLEVALSCHYRVAVPKAQVGLPEVKLGILPGGGGTQRLSRLVGAKTAIEMITTGTFLPAAKALALGIIDHVGEGADPLSVALDFATRLPAGPHTRTRDREEKLAADRGTDVFDTARAALAKSARGQFAPQRCVDAVEAAFTLPFDEGLKRERELFTECMAHDQAKALIHVFFAERAVTKIPDLPADVTPRKLEQVAVLGSGTMGGGIAMCFANAGIPVRLLDLDRAALDRGIAVIAKNYAGTVAKGRLSQADMDKRLSLIQPTTDYADLADADLIVEAVFEDMDVKAKVFRRLDEVAKPGAILASNTSTLDLDAIAANTSRPADVIGMHFFSPANVMKLLEVVRGRHTAPDVIATAMGVGRKIGKVSVLVGNCDGFVGNRMVQYYATEAQRLVIEGASVEQVDKAALEFGLAMGPFAMGDLAGLDVMGFIRARRVAAGLIYGTPLSDRIDPSRKGQKNGRGWYRYEPGSRTPLPDPEITAVVDAYRAERGITPREIGNEEIARRLIYTLVNEGARILDEGMAMRSGDIDIVYIYGYGFPAWRGGPMKFAELSGLDKVLADISRYHADAVAAGDADGAYWEPAPLLKRLVAEGRNSFG